MESLQRLINWEKNRNIKDEAWGVPGELFRFFNLPDIQPFPLVLHSGLYKPEFSFLSFFFQAFFSKLQKLRTYNYDDLHSCNSSLCSSHIWFSYIHNFIIIFSWVYNEPIQRPAPTWLVSLTGRALLRYRRGKGFESRTSLNFFRLSFRNCKSCVYNGDDVRSYMLTLNTSKTEFVLVGSS